VVLLKSGFMLGKVDFLVLLCVLFGQKKGMWLEEIDFMVFLCKEAAKVNGTTVKLSYIGEKTIKHPSNKSKYWVG
jgi:hypothetical protein